MNITLTTDFGTRDPYVAAMKGTILHRQPRARIHDLSHEVTPGDVMEGALFLQSCVPYFPKDTVHVVVIDPGVGTDREKLVVRLAGQFFVLPDNGLITLLRQEFNLEGGWRIENASLLNHPVSQTFHGRDVFAPVAAYLVGGGDPNEVGSVIDDALSLPFPGVRYDEDVLEGEIVHIDRFGNAISNINRRDLPEDGIEANVTIGSLVLEGIESTYGFSPPGTPVALFGSTGYLEVAVNRLNASHALSISKGDTIRIELTS